MVKKIEIRPIENKRDLQSFLKVTDYVYSESDNWCKPINIERRIALSKNQPIFEHLIWSGWVGYIDGIPSGRITAQIDNLFKGDGESKTGFIGFFEAVDNALLIRKLFSAAEAWLEKRSVKKVVGPFSFNINQEVGLLLEGFDTPPYIMMPNGKKYYKTAFEKNGYAKSMDTYSFDIAAKFEPPPLMQKLIKKLPDDLQVRALDKKRVKEELSVLCDIFNDAWSDNWGFIPFTHREFQHLGREMLKIIPTNFIQIAELDRKPVAFIALIPNINPIIHSLNGKLLPFGWLKLLLNLKWKYPSQARIPLMGVRKKYHDTKLGPGLALKVVDSLRKPGISKGVETVEMSWILENNSAMRNIIKILGGVRTKTYRIFEKNLVKDDEII